MKRITKLAALGIGILLSACAQPNLSNSKVVYQTKAARLLGTYATGVSRGFVYGSSGRGAIGAVANDITVSYPDFGQSTVDPNALTNNYGNNYLLQSNMAQEVNNCLALYQDIPKNCGNYPFMVGSLARCLDNLTTYRNPLMTYSYRNLDTRGQQYWAYLLNWRQFQGVQSFPMSQFSGLSPYAASGYLPSNLMTGGGLE